MKTLKRFIKSELGFYLVLAFGGAWALQCAACWCYWQGQSLAYTALLAVSMFVPLASLLLVRRGFGHVPTGVRWKPQFKGRLGWWAAAFAGPAVFCAVGAALYYALFPHRLDLTGSWILANLGQAAYDQMTAAGLTPLAMTVVTLVQGASMNAVINAMFAVGEEAGWRGFLYPALTQALGSGAKARVAGGVIWGAWHWPVMLLVGYEYGFGYWGEPWLGMALFCLVCVCLGTLLDLLYQKTGSIWAAAVGHGSFNAVVSAPLLVLNAADPGQSTVGPMLIGIVPLLPMLAVTVWTLARQAKAETSGPPQTA